LKGLFELSTIAVDNFVDNHCHGRAKALILLTESWLARKKSTQGISYESTT
jgi:hypothetical protein